ncbi:hypothetical protein [Pseudomonas prosekii]|uniref:Uncharacterized protein n=1 Tax=Pseudomonas prosekii TaxID=1148509 RepID=A0A1H2BAE7_9PSED|nr:hypothetical protein [Pseudomonas prosekii]SDT54859.1 hypothetical protein SAMN05216222_5023 [Pseudomonas prosekii]
MDESAKMEEKVAAINKLVDERLKTPEQLAADKIAAEKATEKSVAADKEYADMKAKEAEDAAAKKGVGAEKK